MKSFIFSLLCLFLLAPSAFAEKEANFVLFTSLGSTTGSDSDVSQNAFNTELGFLYAVSNRLLVGFESGHSDADWSLNETKLLVVLPFALVPEDSTTTWKPYFKVGFGSFLNDIKGDRGSDFIWQVEPSIGMMWDRGSWGMYGTTGSNLLLEGSTQFAAVQTKLGIFRKF